MSNVGVASDTKFYERLTHTLHTLALIACVSLWAISEQKFPNMDGVSIYETVPVLPDKSLFIRDASKSNEDNAFSMKALMLDYCVFPAVYNTLIGKPVDQITGTLTSGKKLSPEQATKVQGHWIKLDKEFMKATNVEYNLPYDDMMTTSANPGINTQFYPPVCRCINKVMKIYSNKTNSGSSQAEFDRASHQINNCIASQNIIMSHRLIGNTDETNTQIKNRKYISRYAMLFNICIMYFFNAVYNMLDFNETTQNHITNITCYIFMVLILIFTWLSNLLAIHNVNMGIIYGSLIVGPGIAMFAIIELFWSYVAKITDVCRQSFMHPFCFYIILSSLHTLMLVENGVFTLSVFVTYVLYSMSLTMAYAGVLFVAHGGIWKTGSGASRTGFFILIFLSGISAQFMLTPKFPVNSQLNFIWNLPVVFAVMCYAKLLFLDHMLDEDKFKTAMPDQSMTTTTNQSANTVSSQGANTASNQNVSPTKHHKHKITHAAFYFNLAYCSLLFALIIYYIGDITNMATGITNDPILAKASGRLTKRLNFALGEVNVIKGTDNQPFYNELSKTNENFADRYYLNA